MSRTENGSRHHFDAEEVVRFLCTTREKSLSVQEVIRRLETLGPNRISAHRPTSGFKRFLSVGVFSNAWILPGMIFVIGLQIYYTDAPVMNHLFRTAPIDLHSCPHILAVGFVALNGGGNEMSVLFRAFKLRENRMS